MTDTCKEASGENSSVSGSFALAFRLMVHSITIFLRTIGQISAVGGGSAVPQQH